MTSNSLKQLPGQAPGLPAEKNNEDLATSAPTFFCVGSNHRTADIATREEFFLSAEQIAECLPAASERFSIPELAVLSTCNRCEVFGVIQTSSPPSAERLRDLYAYIHNAANVDHKIDPRNLQDSLYTLLDLDAVRHAFLVASSLNSLVPGETQITGQFKDAITIAKTAGTLGPMLSRLTQEALATAKKVRSNTDIGRHRVSISHAAIDLARRASNDLSQLNFLILGAGEMARVAAEYAASYKPRSLVIANRTRQKAYELTEHLVFGEAHGLENLTQLVARADVVISATSATGYVLTKDIVGKSAKARKSGPLFLIDIALPRDIEPAVSDLDDVYLFDIDDLKSVVDSHMEKRLDAVREATNIVNESVYHFGQWLLHHEVAPTIKSASNYYSQILRKESLKTLSKDIFSSLTAKQRESLGDMLDAMEARFTSDIALTLKKSSPENIRSLAEALDLLFAKDIKHG